jgi:transcriptional regulator with XRE-family HTH domain
MATIYKRLGQKIKKRRLKLGLSQEELSEKAKLDLTSINEIENGSRNPSVKTVHKIALALKTPISELFSD